MVANKNVSKRLVYDSIDQLLSDARPATPVGPAPPPRAPIFRACTSSCYFCFSPGNRPGLSKAYLQYFSNTSEKLSLVLQNVCPWKYVQGSISSLRGFFRSISVWFRCLPFSRLSPPVACRFFLPEPQALHEHEKWVERLYPLPSCSMN